MSTRRVDPARSRIVLLGVPAYTDASIPDEPAIANNIADLVSVLTDPALGAFPAAHVLVAPADAGVEQVGDLLVQAAEDAEDLLLFYYAGHGFPTTRRAELYLSLAGTRTTRLAFTALPFDAVRDAFLDARAASRVMILDSCYSGKAIGRTLGETDVLEQLDIAGTYILTASPATRPAMAALPGERHTAFTSRLLQLLQTGSPQAGPELSLGDIYRHLRALLLAGGLPEPQQRNTAAGDQLALTPNLGYVPPAPPPVQPVALPDDLRAGLDSRYPRLRAAAVSELVAWLDDPDPGRILTAQAELQEIADTDRPEVADLARAALHRHRPPVMTEPEAERPAPADPIEPPSRSGDSRQYASEALENAERLAHAISDNAQKARLLIYIARETADDDPARTSRLLREAETAAQGITDKARKAQVLASVHKAASNLGRAESVADDLAVETEQVLTLIRNTRLVAGKDPERAAQVFDEAESRAAGLTDKPQKTRILTALARAVADQDPDRALRLIDEAVTGDKGAGDKNATANTANTADAVGAEKARLLAGVAQAVAAVDPDRALRLIAEALARFMINESQASRPLAGVSMALSTNNLDQAHAVARAILDEPVRARALADLMKTAAANEPERAAALLDEAVEVARSLTAGTLKAHTMVDLAEKVATLAPDQAIQLFNEAEAAARTITDAWEGPWAMSEIAEALAAIDPDRAEAMARSISDPSQKEMALAAVAEVVAAQDPGRAARLVDEAESIAHSITDEMQRATALAHVAQLVAAKDPDRAARLLGEAESVAQTITDKWARPWALSEIAEAWLELQ